MKPWLELCHRCTFFCAHSLVSFCRWALWLTLALLIVFQVYIGIAREMPVPGFLLKSLETRLAASGISVKFGRTTFDPSGRVLVENLRISLASFEEPVATARLLYVQLDPWALLASRFEPRRLRASGVNLQIPGMISDSGSGENILQDMDYTLTPHEQFLGIDHLTARMAGMSVSVRGVIDLSSLPRAKSDAMPIAELLVKNYPRLCDQLVRLSRQLACLESPRLEVELLPSATLGAIANITLRSEWIEGGDLWPVSADQIELSTRLPLWSNTPSFARISVTAKSAKLPGDIRALGLRSILLARVNQSYPEISPQSAELEIDRLDVQGVVAHALSATVQLDELPLLQADILSLLGQEPVKITGTFNLSEHSANLNLLGKFDPGLLVPLGQKIGHDIRPYLNFSSPPDFDLKLQINPEGKFDHVEGRIAATGVYGYRVTLDRVGGHIFYDGNNFVATDAAASIGTNYAHGSYEHDLTTQDFRFLLQGQLRPPDIGGWFADWWPKFWRNFDFPSTAPDASVDVQGIWRQGYKTSVFVYADSTDPVIKGVRLDHAQTLIYLRPHYYDAMTLTATLDAGSAKGSFIRQLNPEDKSLQRMDFDFESSLALEAAAGLVGAEMEEIVAPFAFSSPPQLHVTGHIAKPGNNPYRQIEIQGNSFDSFTFDGFPLSDLSFRAVMIDDELNVTPLGVGFAGGNTSGQIQIRGPDGQKRLGFDLGLKHGNLHKVTDILSQYFAAKRGEPKPDSSSYIKQTNNVFMDLDVSAEGDLDDPLSFLGSGNAEVSGPGLGEIRLLGLLSELLNFTALRFNDLRTSFKVDKDLLHFSEVSITGSNSAVAAHGRYSLDKNTLNFNARIFPFQESKFILKSLVGAMLTPLSNVLEVKLTGQLDNPKWSFLIGPTNFLRNLSQPVDDIPPINIKTDASTLKNTLSDPVSTVEHPAE